MLSVEKCRQIVKRKDKKYTDDELKIIRDLFYKLASIEYEKYKESQRTK